MYYLVLFAQNKESGESAIRIRILEQDNERLMRKIRGLENQLTELEKAHGERIQVSVILMIGRLAFTSFENRRNC
jgi:hypothetical protein